MERRNFIRLGIAGIGGSIVVPELAIAKAAAPTAGGIYYTKDTPGRWGKKVAGHLPNIELEKGKGSVSVRVNTGHEMKGYDHYIVKHILLDKNYNFLDDHMFNPMKDKAAISTFVVKGYHGPLYALSVCNKHDTWLNMIEV